MTTASMPCALSVSNWREAPFRVGGETVFAIGDVHGCADQLSALLKQATELARSSATRLIFLGDLICRGPSSLDALTKWSARSLDAAFANVHRLAGNHEQLLMLSIGGGDVAESARSKWMSMDGETFVNELRQSTARPDARLTRSLVADAVGETVMQRLDNLEKHVRLGNVVFVHGGIDPALDAGNVSRRPLDCLRWKSLGVDTAAVSGVARRVRRPDGRSRPHAACEASHAVGISRPACPAT